MVCFRSIEAKGRIDPIEFSTVSIARRILYVTFYKLIFRFKPSGGWHGSSTMYLYHFENITALYKNIGSIHVYLLSFLFTVGKTVKV